MTNTHDNDGSRDAYRDFRRDLQAAVTAIALSDKNITTRLCDAYFKYLAGPSMVDVPDDLFVEFRELREDLSFESASRKLPPEKAEELIRVLVDLAIRLAPEYPDDEDE
jgi:hypothetical protein